MSPLMRCNSVEFYDHETGLPKITYADEARRIPNTHPVMLLADGSWPPIWFEVGDLNWPYTTDLLTRGLGGHVVLNARPMGIRYSIECCRCCSRGGV